MGVGSWAGVLSWIRMFKLWDLDVGYLCFVFVYDVFLSVSAFVTVFISVFIYHIVKEISYARGLSYFIAFARQPNFLPLHLVLSASFLRQCAAEKGRGAYAKSIHLAEELNHDMHFNSKREQ